MNAKKIAILGFGREGQSVLKFLQNRGLARTRTRTCADKIWILDRNPKLKIARGIKSQLGKNCLHGLKKFDLIFRSPGIPYNLPELKKARRAGVEFSSATKLFFEEIEKLSGQTLRQGFGGELSRTAQGNHRRRNSKPVIVGITGTKGKGTTATLLYKILKNAGTQVLLAGNIGTSALDILPRVNGFDAAHHKEKLYVILELSSFQLQDLERSPAIAVVLDVFPDHQDSHLNLREYYEAKTNIARHQKPGDKIFFFQNHPLSKWVASKGRGKKIAVDIFDKLSAGETRFKLFKPADLAIPGFHNFKNALMAASVAKDLGVPEKTILKTVKNFRGMEHRLEFVKRTGNVAFYNDSASTNPQTTAAAVRAFPNETKILIAGGFDKGLNYKLLAGALKNSNTGLVVLFGKNKGKIAGAIKNSGIRAESVGSLNAAVRTAYKFAVCDSQHSHKISHHSHYVILFSPGAASFDMFKNYADRGRKFKKLVQILTKV